MNYIRFFSEITLKDIALVGGKNASLGEMIRTLSKEDILVPYGFAVTADAYWHHLEANNLKEKIQVILEKLHKHPIHLSSYSHEIKSLIVNAPLPEDLKKQISQAYTQLSHHYHKRMIDVAVRSSATAEDLPQASFAGQQDTYLYIHGQEALFKAIAACMASLFNERALIYRAQQKFDDFSVALSVGIQKMIRSDKATAGVMFTLDTESGFNDVIIIEAAYGLGELVVKGAITPQEYCVQKSLLSKHFKPIIKKTLGDQHKKLIHQKTKGIVEHPLTAQEKRSFALHDSEILKLAHYAYIIEKHYKQPMDIEWAQDEDGTLYIVQARPETIHGTHALHELTRYNITHHGKVIIEGQSIGQQVVTGKARIIKSLKEKVHFNAGDILVTQMTDPDWVSLIKKAAGMVTDFGGRTCHAAIVSRELKIPAIVGTSQATSTIKDGEIITIDCSQGARGFVYEGKAEIKKEKVVLSNIPKFPSEIFVNLADPDQAFTISQLPVQGVGLARLEFIISNFIKIHPMAISEFKKLPQKLQRQIQKLSLGYATPKEFYVQKLAQSIGMIVGAFYPKPVIVRLTDFKTNEYRNLLGGEFFEPEEENPMLGFRGASRYINDKYAPAFKLECDALKIVREKMGLTNMKIMVPFVRTIQEAQQTLQILKAHGLKRSNNLQVYMMVEIPSNVILLKEFAHYFDGFSIGSNDLTQLTLGVDRDSSILAAQFNERDPAVIEFMRQAITTAKQLHIPIGICGQAPSDYPELAEYLIKLGITSLSLNADSIIPFMMRKK